MKETVDRQTHRHTYCTVYARCKDVQRENRYIYIYIYIIRYGKRGKVERPFNAGRCKNQTYETFVGAKNYCKCANLG